MTGHVPEQCKIIHLRLGRRHLTAPPLEHISIQNKPSHGSLSPAARFSASSLPQNLPPHLLQHPGIRQTVSCVEKVQELPFRPAHRKIHGVIDTAVLSRKNPDPRVLRALLQRSVRRAAILHQNLKRAAGLAQNAVHRHGKPRSGIIGHHNNTEKRIHHELHTAYSAASVQAALPRIIRLSRSSATASSAYP